MSKKQTDVIDLGALQANLIVATQQLKLAQRTKLRADAAYEEAVKLHEQTRVTLNSGVTTLKALAAVPNIYAE